MTTWESRIVRTLALIFSITVLMACGSCGKRELLGKWSSDFQKVESTREIENRATLIMYLDDTFELVLEARGEIGGDFEKMSAIGGVEWKEEKRFAELIVKRWYAEGKLFSEEDDDGLVFQVEFVDEMDRAFMSYPDEDEQDILYKIK